jgi:16S rRNA (guanine527-N7)-methyltransferase
MATRLTQYFELLRHWNHKVNLTGLALEPLSAEALDRLFIEPLVVAAKLPSSSAVWFDLGSGAGSPAIPIKLARPMFELTMIESRSRKAAFLREVVRQLELEDATVENVRLEALRVRPNLSAHADLVTVRAVRIDDVLIAVAGYLLRPGGHLVAFGHSESISGFAYGSHTGFFERERST